MRRDPARAHHPGNGGDRRRCRARGIAAPARSSFPPVDCRPLAETVRGRLDRAERDGRAAGARLAWARRGRAAGEDAPAAGDRPRRLRRAQPARLCARAGSARSIRCRVPATAPTTPPTGCTRTAAPAGGALRGHGRRGGLDRERLRDWCGVIAVHGWRPPARASPRSTSLVPLPLSPTGTWRRPAVTVASGSAPIAHHPYNHRWPTPTPSARAPRSRSAVASSRSSASTRSRRATTWRGFRTRCASCSRTCCAARTESPSPRATWRRSPAGTPRRSRRRRSTTTRRASCCRTSPASRRSSTSLRCAPRWPTSAAIRRRSTR